MMPSLEARAKISVTLRGKKRTYLTDDARRRMSLGRKGKSISTEHKQALINSNIGRIKSLEERTKISNALSREKSPSWKGGISDVNVKIRNGSLYKRWRKAVLIRDEYCCQLCIDKTAEDLEAHHIKGFASFPELRFDVNNGLTICEPCHKYIHRTDHVIV